MTSNVTAVREKIAAAYATLRQQEADLDAQVEEEAGRERNTALDALKARIESERGRHLPALQEATENVRAAVLALMEAGRAHNEDLASWAVALGELDVPRHLTDASTPSPAHNRMGTSGSTVVVGSVHARTVDVESLLSMAVEAGETEAAGREVRDPLLPLARLVETVQPDPAARYFVVAATGQPIRLGPEAAENPNMRTQMSREITGQEHDLLRWGLARVRERSGAEVVPAGNAA